MEDAAAEHERQLHQLTAEVTLELWEKERVSGDAEVLLAQRQEQQIRQVRYLYCCDVTLRRAPPCIAPVVGTNADYTVYLPLWCPHRRRTTLGHCGR